MSLINTLLKDTETIICVGGSSEKRAILSIVFCNISTNIATITMYAYPSSGAAGAASTLIKNLVIPSEESYIWTGDEKIILNTGDTISAICSTGADKVAVTVNYYSMV